MYQEDITASQDTTSQALPATDTTTPVPAPDHVILQSITAQMNNASFDQALPKSARNLSTAHTTMSSLVRFLMNHVPVEWKTDIENAVSTFEKAVQ